MRILIPAILILASCSDSKPKARSAEELRQSVQAAIKAEDYTRAEKDLTELVAQDPKSFDALIGRAAVRIFLGDAQGSEADFTAAVALDAEKGGKARFYISDRAIWRAREFDMKGQKAEALKIYDVLLTLYPKSGMAYHDRGGLKTDMKDYDGAIADLTKAIEFDEGNNGAGDSFVLRARAKRAKGDEAGAAADEAQANAKTNETK
jgi:tetratricopeptide (TPR) repeat protein